MLRVKKTKKTLLQFKTNPLTCYNAKNPHLLDFLLILMMFPFFLFSFKHGGLIKHKMNLKYKKNIVTMSSHIFVGNKNLNRS
jgi:hypothetical protein